MAQLTAGNNYNTGDSVTAANLNSHVNDATLNDGAITEQSAAGATGASDAYIVSQSSALKQITWQAMCAAMQPIGTTTPNAGTFSTVAVNSTLNVTGIATLSGNTVTESSLVVNENGADVDSRIEGDTDANLVYVDAGNDRVGIGTATPATKLDVNGATTITGATTVTGATTLDGAVVINEAGADVDTRIEGDTDVNLVYVDAGNERVGIGTATPSVKLDVVGDAQVSGTLKNDAVVKAWCKFTTASHVATLDTNIKFNVASVAATATANEYKITYTNATPTAYAIAIGQAARDNQNIWSIQTISSTTADITFQLYNRDGSNTDAQDGSVWIAVLAL